MARADGPARTRRRLKSGCSPTNPHAARATRPSGRRRPAGVPRRPLRPDERSHPGTSRASTSTRTSTDRHATATGGRRSNGADELAGRPARDLACVLDDRASPSPAMPRSSGRRGSPRCGAGDHGRGRGGVANGARRTRCLVVQPRSRDVVRTILLTLGVLAEPGVMTSAGRYAPLLEALPHGRRRIGRGRGGSAGPRAPGAAGVRRDALGRRPQQGARPSGRQLLELIVARDPRPLDVPRAAMGARRGQLPSLHRADGRHVRAQGTPARARCGFGAYFGKGRFEDHWVCEYWDAAEERWRLCRRADRRGPTRVLRHRLRRHGRAA